ncbi:hypothetical protein EYF80_024870 [Liparis tanakae]|uniref:Uncharacterized protein n=1 Tax=Liparis tanakae TaxID=230148 RepID=A0A4Z2HJ39_9TELE|nr:hypothetical protein EYF80_024870 [Liparis tanakae]
MPGDSGLKNIVSGRRARKTRTLRRVDTTAARIVRSRCQSHPVNSRMLDPEPNDVLAIKNVILQKTRLSFCGPCPSNSFKNEMHSSAATASCTPMAQGQAAQTLSSPVVLPCHQND